MSAEDEVAALPPREAAWVRLRAITLIDRLRLGERRVPETFTNAVLLRLARRLHSDRLKAREEAATA